MREDLLYRVALTKIPKVGAVTARLLIQHFGNAEAIFKASHAHLTRVIGVGDGIAQSILKADVLNWAEKELDFLDKHAVQVLYHTDKNYPKRLLQINDCPPLLYYKGNADLNHGRIVGVVGTRKPNSYGIRLCEALVAGLQKYNVLIISGLAFGIDGVAHRQCLESGIPTVGVMGNGLQRIYPYEHRDLAHRMCENGGLLTEFPSDQDPESMHFPMRNRIIASCCDALLVVQTAPKGGSMITAQFAADFNKEVFAVPGPAQDKAAAGCHLLIKEQHARLTETAEDIAEVMRWQDLDAKKAIQTRLFVDLTPAEQGIVAILDEYAEEGIFIDVLSYRTQLSHSTIAAHLLNLEFKGLVASLPGKKYALLKRF